MSNPSVFFAKYKPMVFPGEFILDVKKNEIMQLSKEKAEETNLLTARGATHIKSIVCTCCEVKTSTIISHGEYLCTTCKSKKDFGI
jgi:hypothetical protein